MTASTGNVEFNFPIVLLVPYADKSSKVTTTRISIPPVVVASYTNALFDIVLG